MATFWSHWYQKLYYTVQCTKTIEETKERCLLPWDLTKVKGRHYKVTSMECKCMYSLVLKHIIPSLPYAIVIICLWCIWKLIIIHANIIKLQYLYEYYYIPIVSYSYFLPKHIFHMFCTKSQSSLWAYTRNENAKCGIIDSGVAYAHICIHVYIN